MGRESQRLWLLAQLFDNYGCSISKGFVAVCLDLKQDRRLIVW
jgi:hypothetical protein